MEQSKEYLRPVEVARMFSVSLATVRRWVKEGKLSAIVTPGGHNRIEGSSTYALYESCRTSVDTIGITRSVL